MEDQDGLAPWTPALTDTDLAQAQLRRVHRDVLRVMSQEHRTYGPWMPPVATSAAHWLHSIRAMPDFTASAIEFVSTARRPIGCRTGHERGAGARPGGCVGRSVVTDEAGIGWVIGVPGVTVIGSP